MTITILFIQFFLFFGGIGLILLALGILHLTEQSIFQFIFESSKSRILVGCLGGFFLLIGLLWFLYANTALLENQATKAFNLGMPVDLNVWNPQTHALEDLEGTISNTPACGEVVQSIEIVKVELLSKRANEGYTSPIQSIQYRWLQPIDDKPLIGILARLCIEPYEGEEGDKIFRHFFMEYELDNSEIAVYTSSDKYITLNRWNTLVWDFTGTIWPNGTHWEDDWRNLSDNLETDGHWFNSISRQLGEQMTYNAILASESGGDATWKERVQAIGVKCDVSANIEYTSTSNPTFLGDFYFGDVWIQPIDYP